MSGVPHHEYIYRKRQKYNFFTYRYYVAPCSLRNHFYTANALHLYNHISNLNKITLYNREIRVFKIRLYFILFLLRRLGGLRLLFYFAHFAKTTVKMCSTVVLSLVYFNNVLWHNYVRTRFGANLVNSHRSMEDDYLR